VYIDANHNYEFVNRDPELFLPLVKQSGFLTGDDYPCRGPAALSTVSMAQRATTET
jgi:hypothetical protein